MRKLTVLIAILFMFAVTCLFPEPVRSETSLPSSDTVLTEIGRWAWGISYAVDAKGQYAYIGNGPTFQVLDITNPSSPQIVGVYLTDVAFLRDIKVRGSLAYVISDGLLILDISIPSSPQRVGYVQISGLTLRVALADSFAFVSAFTGVIRVVDISDPRSPRLRGGSIVEEWPYCLAAKGRYAYASGLGDISLSILNAANPDSVLTRSIEIGGTPTAAVVQDTLLIVGTTTFSQEHVLKTFSIAKADSPLFLGQTQSIGNNDGIRSITVQDNITYFATDRDAVYSVNTSNPRIPVLMSHTRSPIPLYGGQAISSSGGIVFAAYPGKIWIVDATKPDSLVDRASFATGGWVERVAVKDSLLFVAARFAGLWILDISDPEQPRGIANLDRVGFAYDVLVENNLVYVLSFGIPPHDTLRGVSIVDISNPRLPQIISRHAGIASTSVEAPSMVKFSDMIFRSENGYPATLEIIDVSDPIHPVQLSVFQRPYYTRDIAVRDSFAYWTASDSGLRIIDCRNPYSPVEISPFGNETTFSRIGVQDSFAYVNNSNTLFVLDISNPYAVHTLSALSGSYAASDLFALSGFVYGASGYVVDVSDPGNPREVGRSSSRNAVGVTARSDLVFFAEESNGVSILRNQLITSVKEDHRQHLAPAFELYQNYPNPFNPSTVIPYLLPVASVVTLKVYNILGQEVTTLLNEVNQSGKHEVVWDAARLPSGVYFYRLSAGSLTETKKLVLIR